MVTEKKKLRKGKNTVEMKSTEMLTDRDDDDEEGDGDEALTETLYSQPSLLKLKEKLLN